MIPLTQTIADLAEAKFPTTPNPEKDIYSYEKSIITNLLSALDQFIPRIGQKVVLDKDFNNSSVVWLVRLGDHKSTVEAEGKIWDTMTDRLSPISTTHP